LFWLSFCLFFFVFSCLFFVFLHLNDPLFVHMFSFFFCFDRVDVELYYHDIFFLHLGDIYSLLCYSDHVWFFKFLFIYCWFFWPFTSFFCFLIFPFILISFYFYFFIVFLNLRCHYENIYNFFKIGDIVINYVIILCCISFL
jgi:hypothetical protein